MSDSYQSLKQEVDDVVSAVGKAMSESQGDWAGQLRAMAEAKPQVETVVGHIGASAGQGTISGGQAQELQDSLLKRLKQYGVSLG